MRMKKCLFSEVGVLNVRGKDICGKDLKQRKTLKIEEMNEWLIFIMI